MSDVEDNDYARDSPASGDDVDHMSDKDSDVLSEVDENQFEDYDPTTAPIEERPVEIDEDIAKTLKASKRKRADGETVKKPKEGRREKKRRTDDDVSADGEVLEGKRIRKGRADGGARRPREEEAPEPAEDETLTPEQRRARALERAMDAAIKGPTKRRRKKDEVVRPSSRLRISFIFHRANHAIYHRT